MKKTLYFTICLIAMIGLILTTIGLILTTGCTNATSQNELSIATRGNQETHQVTENIWWIRCSEWGSCDLAFSNFSQNHKILSFAPLTNGVYGSTTGYYVIVDESVKS